jgi:hypothetical protein
MMIWLTAPFALTTAVAVAWTPFAPVGASIVTVGGLALE